MSKDYSGIKFLVAEALGESMQCLYMKGDNTDGFQFNFYHHKDGDGMACLKDILQSEGHHLNSLPGLKSTQRPSLEKRLLALWRYIKLTKKVSHEWLYPRKDCTGTSKDFVYVKISQGQIDELLKKTQKASLNSFLLNALDHACHDLLLASQSERKWVLPFNMRDAENALNIDGNYSSSIVLNFRKKATTQEVHNQIRDYLKKGVHWGAFIYTNMARFIGFKGTLKVARSIKEVGTGVFSNLGVWPNHHVELANEEITWRGFVAPGTQILPIAATAWQWQQTLCLTLQLHRSLNLEENGPSTDKVMRQWLQYLGVTDFKLEVVQWDSIPGVVIKP